MDQIVARALRAERPLRLLRVQGSAAAFVAARLRQAHSGPILLISPNSQRADQLEADFRSHAGDIEVQRFPRYDVAPFDRFSPHPEIEARRMSLLYRLLASGEESSLTVIAPWSALLRRVLPREELRGRVTRLQRGMTVDRDALLQVLISAGYHHTKLVEERGEVATRGAILDIFPPQLERPVRVELDFDEIVEMRQFDPATQRSSEVTSMLVAIPPRGYRIGGDSDALLRRVREMGREKGAPESQIYAVTEVLARRRYPPGIENLEALFHARLETVFDYLPESFRIVIEDPEEGRARARLYFKEIVDGHARAVHGERLVCDPLELYLNDETAWAEAMSRHPLLLDSLGAIGGPDQEEVLRLDALDHRELRREIVEQQGSGHALEPLTGRLERWRGEGRRVRITAPSLSAAERLVDILRDYGHELQISSKGRAEAWAALPEPGGIDIAVSPLTAGFELASENLVLLAEQDIFGTRVRRRPLRSARAGQAIDRLGQIQQGDFLVHAEHGIGRYGGLVQLDVAGYAQEFVLVHYAQNDKLYLPVSRLAQIQHYSSTDGHGPRLDRLGAQTWVRTKRRVKRAVQDMAQGLIAVVAARELLQGHAYPALDAGYEEFEARFPYEDTPDQRSASEDVLADLQSPRPMDRLVCGDVGFGKTEIACRAAYIVTASGRQVAFLVPTTVLCQQHLTTLRERFAHTPVEIGSLSRLSPPREVRQVREGLASGRIDLVVGTHRLLSKDIQFRNPGLLVVDEEHRFGVAHKERIKQLRKLVDVLTLSATPIPRTLQMAFTGMRDLSLITTPPPDRVAIRTQICRLSEDLVRDAIERERQRGGQTFFVHNRVETINEIAEYVRRVVPDASVAVVHGQMPARQLEKIMLAFMEREYDVLVCTAIIESGLDIPNVNTILIHRADLFGLAQLYQLRGRVGRSDRRAFAYLFVQPEGRLTPDARRRIDAIQDLSELGAGFRLATEDLEIRGAGNLLGPEQSGHIASVGYDLYMEMLEQAMAELRGQETESVLEPEIKLPVAALLPESYVADVNQRLVLYKQLSSTRDEADLREVHDDVLDRFGPLPPEARNLIEVIRLKIHCKQLGIQSLEVAGRELVLKVGDTGRIDPGRLVQLLNRPATPIRVTPDQCVYLKLRRPEDSLAESFGLLELLSPQSGSPDAGPTLGARQ
jgi:transcription-repair coupling factor (superfamily II helicase)